MTVLESDTQKVIRTFNVELLITSLMLFAMGMITLYSATHGSGLGMLVKKQLISFGVACVLAIPFVFIDSQVLQRFSYVFYCICVVLLALVLIIGKVGGGSERWISLGFFNMQPSEFTKIAIVMAFARYFSDEKHGAPYTLRSLLFPAVLMAPSVLLILLQPDLGTSGIVFITGACMVLFLGVSWRSLLIVILLGAVTVPIAYKFVLKDYQKKRVLTFIDPGSDPRGSGYNALQSKIAVGSGRLMGKGYLKGTQSQLNFIPEQQTDFIFSVLSEERGFVGGIVVIFFYLLYCHFSLRTVRNARTKYQMLLAFGLFIIFFWHVVINLGMVLGLLPIVGVTLPFFSYGGTSVLTFVISTALLLNLSRKRYIF